MNEQAMSDWLRLINAETEEDLTELEQNTSIPEVKKTINIVRELSADEAVRQEALEREKQLEEEANAISVSCQKTSQEEQNDLRQGEAGEKQNLVEKRRAMSE